jgi:uncharacterized protein (TIGR02284 family)
MDTVLSTLNKLLETTKDGESGFRACAGAVKNADLKAMFEGAAHRRGEGAAELQAAIRSLGQEPAASSGMARGARRINTKSLMPGMDELAALTECERGEDVAKCAYEKALMDDLPADIKAIVQRQYEVVKADRNRIRDLRDWAFLGMVGWA